MVARQSLRLTLSQVRRRAAQTRLVLTDNDGVLTDTGVYYNEHGEALKRFSIRDGMGIELLRKAGIETAIITSELSPSVRRRAEKLKMKRLYLGIKDKESYLEFILRETRLSVSQLAYMGDDVNDLGIIRLINSKGLTGCPQDAMDVVRKSVHFRSAQCGGHGAFRDFAEWILHARGVSTERSPLT